MAVEIKELIIRASVNNNKTGESGDNEGSLDKQEIIRDCVKQVLEILKREKER